MAGWIDRQPGGAVADDPGQCRSRCSDRPGKSRERIRPRATMTCGRLIRPAYCRPDRPGTTCSHSTTPTPGNCRGLSRNVLSTCCGEAFLARRIGHADALLLAFDQDADYDSPNFLWFRSRYSRFVYVDRIVVAPAAGGAVTPGVFMAICSSTCRWQGMSVLFAKSIRILPTRPRMLFMRRWDLSKSVRRRFTAAAR